ncbi:hypothetical protein EX895_001137 [Sporisorium graminicola]|uniref:Uncharacterized protein n=1 Tax=Sporisorium graminicola TaxID=280036 RepID=A0A4U7KZ54_9BASI|nr:hypothetical protein EX895_001137 [Sporisorium graminicola]TKY89840.1 hypothetical protein EX895_001137 [Sporisorium graminicola]
MATTSTSTAASPRSRRHEVEIYAHALRTRLQFASFKALNGVGKTSLSDLTLTPTTTIQPLTPSFASNNQPADNSLATTPALSQGESLLSSSQSSTRSTRSIYLDIFGSDFRPSSSATSTPSSSTSLSRATSFASTSTPSKRPATNSSTSTRSLLDKAASSPQLGSPERKNGRFDWHNNPTPAMVAHENKLAAQEDFALPTGSPSKRRREASQNAASGAHNPLLNTPRRSRMQSGGFLPNGHPASSLAQDLGLTAPRTPRSRHTSGRHVFALQPQTFGADQQDQAERDRVASTLAALAEARNASSGSDSSSSSDRPHTPPPPTSSQSAAGLAHGFSSPSIRSNSTAFAHPPGHSVKRHKRNVSWNLVPSTVSTHDVQAEEEEEVSKDEEVQRAEDAGEDRAAADYLLFLASSPSPSTSIKRFSGDTDAVGTNGILSTPAQTSLWDPFHHHTVSSNGSSSGGFRRSRMQSGLGWPRHTNLSSSTGATPLTPPPSARKPVKDTSSTNPTAEKSGGGGQEEAMVGLGFDAHTLSSATSSPQSSVHQPAANAQEYMRRRASTASLRSGSPPRTPPPSCATPLFGQRAREDAERSFEGYGVTTPPNAPGAPGGDTTFSYADFVNVSPSPQPPSTGRFAGAGGAGLLGHYAAANSKTPTRTNRFRFDPRPM